jgi:hypothetical protein
MRRTSIVVVLACLLVPDGARAQLSGGLSLGSGVGQLGGGGAWMRESRLTPALSFSSPFSAFTADATVAERGGAMSFDRATIASVLTTPAFGPFRLSIDGGYRRDETAGLASVASVAPALSARRGRVGAWFGSVLAERAAPRLQVGVWTSARSLLFSLAGRTQSASSSSIVSSFVWDSVFNDTTGGWNRYKRTTADTVSRRVAYRWSQLEARMDWSYGRLALTGSLATGRTESPRADSLSGAGALVWGRVNGAYMLSGRTSLIAGLGSQPAPRGRAPTARFATVGVRFSPAMLLREPLPAPVRPAASSFSLSQLEPGIYRLVIRVPSARSVELSGDFNRWTAVAMQQTAPGVWEVALALAPGTHRVNVRIDGDRWTAPPGLPAVNDEFSGRVGILVVR